MRVVFLDTVGLLALWDMRDQWHAAALVAYDGLTRSKAQLYSTEAVFLECANAAARSPFRSLVADMHGTLTMAGGILLTTQEEVKLAWNDYQKGVSGQPGVVDLLSFAVMRRFGITEAFTNDRHFKSAGFVTLF